MEIMFSMKIKEDGKTVRVEMPCTECQTELEMAKRGRDAIQVSKARGIGDTLGGGVR